MNAVSPGFNARLDLISPVTEHFLEVFIPPQRLGLEIPIPDGVECSAICVFEALETFPQRILGLLTGGPSLIEVVQRLTRGCFFRLRRQGVTSLWSLARRGCPP